MVTPILPPVTTHSVTLDGVSNFASLPIDLNGSVHLDEEVRVVEGASIMGHQVWDSFVPSKIFLTLHNLDLTSSGVIR